MSSEAFLLPRCRPDTVDRFGIRKDILSALSNELPNFRGNVLDIGCGRQPYRTILLSPPSKATRYIGLDFPVSKYGRPDLAWDGNIFPLEDNSVECAIATEVFEHCPDPEIVMREAWRVLKSGGFLFFTVPFLWPLHDTPDDYYRYTSFALKRHLANSSFSQAEIWPLGGWDASLAQMIGLWVRRRPMRRRPRQILSYLAVPIIKILRSRDRRPQTLGDNVMATGFAGKAIK